MRRPPVLEVRVNCVDWDPPLLSICPGYEDAVWRQDALVRDVFDRHLVNFASSYSYYKQIDEDNFVEVLRRAAKAVYQTDKYGKRGEFGELLLHAILRDFFQCEPAVSKLYFKDGPNDTVKGFDAVHIVTTSDGAELWLGEVKYYSNLTDAVREVVTEIGLHLGSNYLRGEFIAITNKLDVNWPYRDLVARMIDENISLDKIFRVLTIPILLTYNSTAVSEHQEVSDEYVADLKEEAQKAWDKFVGSMNTEWKVKIHLILMPLLSKESITTQMHRKLDLWKQI